MKRDASSRRALQPMGLQPMALQIATRFGSEVVGTRGNKFREVLGMTRLTRYAPRCSIGWERDQPASHSLENQIAGQVFAALDNSNQHASRRTSAGLRSAPIIQ